jgi:ParB family chromosome partitioning protein
MGHARTLLGVDHEPTQLRLRKRVVDRKLSVRELEKIVQNYKDKPKTPRARSQSGADHSDIERRLTEALSAPVKVKLRESAQGRIEIAFGSLEELERLVSALSDHPDRA